MCSEKNVLRNFAKLTRKQLCQSLFFYKVAGLKCLQVFSWEFCEISKNILLPFLLLFSMKHSYMLILPGCFSTNLEEYKFKYPDRIQSLMVLQSFFVRNFLKEISIIIILFFLLLNFPASCS